MSERLFEMRMQCAYAQPDNMVAQLQLQMHRQDGWEGFALSNVSPGFEMFVCAVLTCQHTYFRLNCAERGLLLRSATGQVAIRTDEDWLVRGIQVVFEGELEQGEPTAAAIAYIAERMPQCPVSVNLHDAAESSTDLSFR